MRATIESTGSQDEIPRYTCDTEFPPIEIMIEDAEDSAIIKVIDKGGGIAPCNMDKIWSFLFTTADTSRIDYIAVPVPYSRMEPPMAGYGYGLPLSRMYCQFFGGDLRVESTEGVGTNATCVLKRLDNSKENPIILRC